MSIIVSSLPTYVEQNSDKLLKGAILGAESAKDFTLQTGVKTKTALNLLGTEIVFQDGSACGWNAEGTSTISQRTITAPAIKINQSFCDKVLENTCLQHDVRVAAGQKTLPFEQDFIQQIVDNVSLGVEKLIWQGDVKKTTDNTLKWGDGLIKILKAADGITVSGQKLTHAALTKANIRDAVDAVVAVIPAEVLPKSKIYMGYDTYRLYIMALQAANLYHVNGDGLDVGETTYQGSNIVIKAVAGLNGTSEIVAGAPSNFYFGTDMQNDQESFDFWYSKDAQEFRLAIELTAGAQVAYPNEVVISSLSA